MKRASIHVLRFTLLRANKTTKKCIQFLNYIIRLRYLLTYEILEVFKFGACWSKPPIKPIIKLPPNIGVYIIKRVGWISTRLPNPRLPNTILPIPFCRIRYCRLLLKMTKFHHIIFLFKKIILMMCTYFIESSNFSRNLN